MSDRGTQAGPDKAYPARLTSTPPVQVVDELREAGDTLAKLIGQLAHRTLGQGEGPDPDALYGAIGRWHDAIELLREWEA